MDPGVVAPDTISSDFRPLTSPYKLTELRIEGMRGKRDCTIVGSME
ncbi:predicted protein [Sclerotinia sclerotiorum 1980 UF-70]|uniref:Uncharacterized protein n=1 Tax=Sclerotinia sclerotiorum (strain ATCC 18683 / 1980 / Ss-1) TaxID=665079 RepID=A7ECJ6_SCLS1|nr:predicted protein [Sclerotinia sclerotiorum 1980 UF-70]EDO00175.1 predicted protein [Sclerotinia sclerotiorum 1980 UF-70]